MQSSSRPDAANDVALQEDSALEMPVLTPDSVNFQECTGTTTAAAASPSGSTAQVLKTKLRKKRGDPSRTNKKRDAPFHKQQQQKEQSFARRCARARWAFLMLLPQLFLLLHCSEEAERESRGLLTPPIIVSVFSALAVVAMTNELCGRSHIPTYVAAFAWSVMWGGMIHAIRHITAARLLCMVWFGVCGGNLRYHWDDDVESKLPAGKQHNSGAGSQRLKANIISGEGVMGYSSGSTTVPWSDTAAAPSSEATDVPTSGAPKSATSPASMVEAEDVRSPSRSSELFGRSLEFCRSMVWRKVGLGICATLGEVLGCALWVPNSWSEVIAVSWMGYAAVVVVPIFVYKCASWVSHLLILVCGSRVNTADASRLLLLYWAATTILSLGTLVITLVWLLTSLVPYVWSLQVLVTPYSVIFELIAFESKEYQATNPYKEVAEVYREHIHSTMQNSKEYFLR